MNPTHSAKHVLLYAGEPGSANFLRYLPPICADVALRSSLVGEGNGYGFLRDRGMDLEDVRDTDADQLLSRYRPSVLVSGTEMSPDAKGLALVSACRERGIPTAAVADGSMMAHVRFRGHSTNPLHHFPDLLFVTEDATAKVYEELGAPRESLMVTGHPHYQAVRERSPELQKRAVRAMMRRRHFPDAPPGAPLVLFVAEPEIERGDTSGLVGRFRGWSGNRRRTPLALEALILALRDLDRDVALYIRPHPKNEEGDFAAYADQVLGFCDGTDSAGVIAAADLVVGISSSLLVEAPLVGTRCVSIRIREADFTDLPEFARGYIEVLEDDTALRRAIGLAVEAPRDQPVEPPALPDARHLLANALMKLVQIAEPVRRAAGLG